MRSWPFLGEGRDGLFLCNMQYGQLLQQVPVGDSVVALYVPDEQLLKQSFERREIPFPYWGKLWPAAKALAQWLQQHPQTVRNKQVLELGAGLGLPSLVAAGQATSVWCTDVDALALEYVQASAAHTGLKNVFTDVVNWTSVPAHLQPDVVLLSDVNYNPDDFAPLIKTIERFLHQPCTVILSTPQRLMAKPFVEALMSHTYSQQAVTIEQTAITLLMLQ